MSNSIFRSIKSYYITSGSITVNGPGIITVFKISSYNDYYCMINIDNIQQAIYLKPSDANVDGRVILFESKAVISVKGSGIISFGFSVGLFN